MQVTPVFSCYSLGIPLPVFIVGYLRIVCWGVKILVLVIWDSLKMPLLARGVGCGLTLVEGRTGGWGGQWGRTG